ncbi:hypothetical protein [Dietzia sp. 179-F 9C3 NHS]|uniref:hypothetical protein n=1 Tax=Dietzia sp. 179-F 9C3 NHS TaxID=3374295 RepID=UPI0038793276
MCRPATCTVCGKTTWAGCGQHIDAVKATVPAPQWCGGQHSRAETDAATASGAQGGGFFSSLFGR